MGTKNCQNGRGIGNAIVAVDITDNNDVINLPRHFSVASHKGHHLAADAQLLVDLLPVSCITDTKSKVFVKSV